MLHFVDGRVMGDELFSVLIEIGSLEWFMGLCSGRNTALLWTLSSLPFYHVLTSWQLGSIPKILNIGILAFAAEFPES